ncbi:thiamine pyrophosphokinase [Lipomyces arxii]|uniref:thiamine pyrophosphokinase n=1 Tax=Lipomyces arxii TaxID=56418 RepID=UPI0034CD6B6D
MPITEDDLTNAKTVDRAWMMLPSDDIKDHHGEPYALIILNQPIGDIDMLDRVWKNAAVVACADGGANRLYSALDEMSRVKYLPDFIAGDLDSLKVDVRTYYENLGVTVYHSSDQDSTDFGKCLLIVDTKLGKRTSNGNRIGVVALGGTGGRVDQAFHSIHSLFVHEYGLEQDRREVTLLSDDSLTFLIGAGTSKLFTPRSVLGPTCGIIPVSGPAVISTQGLTWDVSDWETRFDLQVSTSNAMEADDVFIKSDVILLFTVEVP